MLDNTVKKDENNFIANKESIKHKQNNVGTKIHVSFSKLEKILISCISVLMISLSIILLNEQITLTNNEHILQDNEEKILSLSNKNSDAKQSIGELTEKSRLSSLAKKDNLKFHEKQIRIIR